MSFEGQKTLMENEKCWVLAFSPFPTFSKGFFMGLTLKTQQSGRLVQFNSLSNDKFLDWSKLTAFADNKINLT